MDNNVAKTTYEWAMERLAEGRNVYFTNHLKSFKITPKNQDVLNSQKDGLYINKECICLPHARMCKVTASFN